MSIGTIPSHPPSRPIALTAAPKPQTAPDGDSPAVEAAERAATKSAETSSGGAAPKATPSVNKLA